jgi:hypothetical protein
MLRKRKSYLQQVGAKPKHEKLPWPGLKAKDHLTRVITRALKEAREAKENEEWAGNQIARVLDYVSPHTAARVLFQVTNRRRRLTASSRKLFSDFLRQWKTQIELNQKYEQVNGQDR